MKIKKDIILFISFFVLILGLLTGCGGQHSASPAQESVKDVSKEKLSDEVKWLVDCKASDNTNEHLQNMSQNYQILEDHILYTDVRNVREENKKLYALDRDGKNQRVILDNVYRFVELNEKIYFSKWGDGDLELQKIYVYDIKDQKTEELKMDDIKIYEFITVQESKLVFASLNNIYEYDLVSGAIEEIMDYPMSTPCKVFADGGQIIFIEDGNIDLISMNERKVKRIQKGKAHTHNIGAYTSGVLYIGVDCYSLEGANGTMPLESSQNGLWKINLADKEKEKVLEKSPVQLFLLNGKLYDERLLPIQ